MKKSLVLAMAMALGVTASAYAANPFSDVPAGHWAYDSIDKLAAAGVVDGMGDGSFQGDRHMTRYEMAQIVAKAMAKGANVDKLAAEFADELDALGVRVANLEKKADNVTITGQVRWDYAHRHDAGRALPEGGTKEVNRLRTRLFLNGQINEDWAYHARLENTEAIDNAASENSFDMNRAWVTGRVGGLKVIAGKAPIAIADANLFDSTMERVEVAYGKKVVVSAFVGNADATKTNDDVWGAKVATKAGKLSLAAEYTSFKDETGKAFTPGSTPSVVAGAVVAKPKEPVDSLYGQDNAIYDIVLKYQFNKNVGVNYTYLNADADGSRDGIGNVVGIDYKGADAKKPGSWGMWAKYYNMGRDIINDNATMNVVGDMVDIAGDTGFQGYGVGLSYTFAKNITGYAEYYNLDNKESSKSVNTIFTRLQFAF